MSRIHEALRKAAEERAKSGANTAVTDFVDVAGGLTPTPVQPPLETLKPSALPDLQTSSFDELIRRCAHPKWNISARQSAFHVDASDKHGAERFRTLRSRLYQISTTQTLKKVLITSSVPAEGKTFVAANLAQSIAQQADRKVLLMDVDLRASRLHMSLGAPSEPGLTDYLLGKTDEFGIIQHGMEGSLCFIPGGCEVSNPSELLLSDRLKQFLSKMADIFDWVILDSPPALPVHDASVLADLCDGLLFVVRAGVTDFEVAARGAAEFEGKNLLGVVLNGTEDDSSYGGYYYYGRETDGGLDARPKK